MRRRAWTAVLVAGLVLASCVDASREDTRPADRPRDEVATREPSRDAAARVPLPTVAPAPPATVTERPFDADRALRFATELADGIGPRPAGSQGDAAARELLRAAFEDAGWTVEEQPFPLPQGGSSANVVAWRGRGPSGSRHVVIGGHLDTVEGSPGANDNASGIGVLLALAEELADEDPEVPVALVGFGAEEYQPSQPRDHHIGSRAYAAAHADRVVAALSVDMVGNGGVTCICWFGAGPDVLAQRLRSLAPGDGYEVRAEGDISDHGPFARRGLPAALLWTGRDGRYHTPADTSEHLRVDDIRRAGDLVLAFVRDLRAEERDGRSTG